MRHRKVPILGREASVVILGSTVFGTGAALEATFEQLDAYSALGGNWIDVARVYGQPLGDAEKAVGLWLRERKCRHNMIIGTKGGHPPLNDMHRGRLDRESLQSDLEQSLAALGVDCVDVYYVHRDDTSRPVGDILETLNGFTQNGRVKLLGVSNWTTARIREANAYARAHGLQGFSANQPMWSLARCLNEPDDTLVQMDAEMYRFHAQEESMLVTPYTSQAKGYFMKLETGTLSEKAAARYDGPENRAIFDRLNALKAQTGHSLGALQLAWLTCQDFPVFPIVGASNLTQVKALKEATNTVLTPEQVREIRSM